MQTGLVESWAGNPLEIGPIYPFVGWEVFLFAICVIYWLAYTLWQMKFEHDTHAVDSADLNNRDNHSNSSESLPDQGD